MQGLHLDDVTIEPTISEINSRSLVNLNCKHKFANGAVLEGTPVVVANMDACGTIEMAKALYPYGIGVALHKYIPTKDLVKFFNTDESKYSWFSIGISDTDYNKLKEFKTWAKIDRLHIDTPNGYLKVFHEFVSRIRRENPHSIIMAGNICTWQGAVAIADAGADIVKVGIAQGGWCDTRNKASIGVPQLSAIAECNEYLRGNTYLIHDTFESNKEKYKNVIICSDGGVRTPAHIANAIAAGASLVMSGSLFMGYDECNEENWEFEYEYKYTVWNWGISDQEIMWRDIIPTDTEKYGQVGNFQFQWTGNRRCKRLRVYGMSSKAANEKYNGGMNGYKTSEGKEGWVEPKGPVSELAKDIRGSLASTCTYTNKRNIQDLIGYNRFRPCKSI
jgi:GMP reductase